ncbi:hypothetical protein HYH02_003148 [Chlamydomonas schloesseri]|uniref:Retrotransposon gag domain-containing protein n=1 Tax=Chlamydomonas schloesseri TaxID=2026947 RepID=A0A835WQB3_9CHLO|nr:hypothetical protein HYH02_003148 [Chlamydomonas schloesseri]|eukprot:KAG2452114.1 hypothetical protein HYH02_003148 [Chlamydomonas schloesseri]
MTNRDRTDEWIAAAQLELTSYGNYNESVAITALIRATVPNLRNALTFMHQSTPFTTVDETFDQIRALHPTTTLRWSLFLECFKLQCRSAAHTEVRQYTARYNALDARIVKRSLEDRLMFYVAGLPEADRTRVFETWTDFANGKRDPPSLKTVQDFVLSRSAATAASSSSTSSPPASSSRNDPMDLDSIRSACRPSSRPSTSSRDRVDLPSDVIRQRLEAQVCLRCGASDHMKSVCGAKHPIAYPVLAAASSSPRPSSHTRAPSRGRDSACGRSPARSERRDHRDSRHSSRASRDSRHSSRSNSHDRRPSRDDRSSDRRRAPTPGASGAFRR